MNVNSSTVSFAKMLAKHGLEYANQGDVLSYLSSIGINDFQQLGDMTDKLLGNICTAASCISEEAALVLRKCRLFVVEENMKHAYKLVDADFELVREEIEREEMDEAGSILCSIRDSLSPSDISPSTSKKRKSNYQGYEAPQYFKEYARVSSNTKRYRSRSNNSA